MLEKNKDDLRRSIHEYANDLSFSDEENFADDFDPKPIVNQGKKSNSFGGINKSHHDFVQINLKR